MGNLNLDKDEQILLISRRYFLTLIKHLMISFFLVAMTVFEDNRLRLYPMSGG